MVNSVLAIPIPSHWHLPKFRFLQRVKFTDNFEVVTEEFGIIIGLEYQSGSTDPDYEVGWWYYIHLDESSPSYQQGLLLCRHEDYLTLLDSEEVN